MGLDRTELSRSEQKWARQGGQNLTPSPTVYKQLFSGMPSTYIFNLLPVQRPQNTLIREPICLPDSCLTLAWALSVSSVL